ncbi:hypothetical protein DAI22_09g060650 [Oryza sativa Japonica Group]|nr:hypothetical protein DAI22_09g060650 [Oryza sativa Japonica Group]
MPHSSSSPESPLSAFVDRSSSSAPQPQQRCSFSPLCLPAMNTTGGSSSANASRPILRKIWTLECLNQFIWTSFLGYSKRNRMAVIIPT